jgi:hypothetical protein
MQFPRSFGRRLRRHVHERACSGVLPCPSLLFVIPTPHFRICPQRVGHGIGMPFGLHLVRYGGGADFSFVDASMHLQLQRARPPAANPFASAAAAEAVRLAASTGDVRVDEATFPVRVMAHAMQAAAAAIPNMMDLGRGDFWPCARVLCSEAYWAAATWELHVVASTPVPRHERANLYFHGWLHEASRLQGKGSEILQPLIGVYCARGSVQQDRGDDDLLADGTT